VAKFSSTTPDRELSEAAFHSKYSYMAGWDDAREMVMQARRASTDPTTMEALRALWESMGNAVRDEKRDAHVQVLEG
jgi:hypothetical protein